MKPRIWWTVFLSGSLAALAFAAPGPTKDRYEEVAANMVSAINASDAKAFSRDFNEKMRQAVPLSEIERVLKEVRSEKGAVLSRKPPTWPSPDTAVYRLDMERGSQELVIALDAEQRVSGALLRPAPPGAAVKIPERNSVALRLPFHGRWRVFWGGDTPEQNVHHHVPNQRFAFDFSGVTQSGASAQGDGTKNEDYAAYGREILSPTAGVVTDVIDGVRDNRPGSMNPYFVLGNAVILRLAEDQYAVLAHLKPGSLRVKPGEKVSAGQTLGLCGNSGNSSEPHLHFHLQQTPIIQDGIGIKCFFESITVEHEGRKEQRHDYSPVKGDILAAE